MTTVAKANLVFKDKNGNVGYVKTPTDTDLSKISTAITDLAQVVDPTSHLPVAATTTDLGCVQLADSTAISQGTSGRVVDAAQLKSAIEGASGAAIDVSSTYTEPSASTGLLSTAEDRLTSPTSTVDYDYGPLAANTAMPSETRITLTVSGGAVTAPAAGYINLVMTSTAASQRCCLISPALNASAYSTSSGETVSVVLPVASGDSVSIIAGSSTYTVYFVYCNGSVPA